MLIFGKHELGVLKHINHILFLAHFNDTLVLHFSHLVHNIFDLILNRGTLPVVLHTLEDILGRIQVVLVEVVGENGVGVSEVVAC